MILEKTSLLIKKTVLVNIEIWSFNYNYNISLCQVANIATGQEKRDSLSEQGIKL